MNEKSPRLKKEAARLACKEEHILMADLVLSGYTEAETYDIAFPENIAWGAQRKIHHREQEFASEGYKRAYEEKRETRKHSVEAVEYRDKDAVEAEINALINQTTDVKMRSELLMKLADLKQMKKDASAADENPVQFFLPIDCNQCPLLDAYNQYVADKITEEITTVRPDEMQRIIETAIPKMSETKKAGF